MNEIFPDETSDSVDVFMNAVSVLEDALKSLPDIVDEKYYHQLVQALTHVSAVHQAYDDYVASALIADEKNITCKKGCSSCCRHFVTSVEPFEILALDFQIRKTERYSDLLFACHNRVTKFDQLLKKEGEDSEAEDRALYRYYLRGAVCPFLEMNGECGVYENRPMSCRMFFAESPPRFCSGKEVVSPWNRNFQIELPDRAEEALVRCSALLDKLEMPVGLFAGVLEANALFGRFES